jgi:hypothetical protein
MQSPIYQKREDYQEELIMFEVNVGKVRIHPELNPAILDSASWDTEWILECLKEEPTLFWFNKLETSIDSLVNEIKINNIIFYNRTACRKDGCLYVLAEFPDKQHVFFVLGEPSKENGIGTPFVIYKEENKTMSLYKTDIDIVNNYVKKIDKSRGPRALGYTPRLGIGTRMNTAIWPAAFEVMKKLDRPANAIQNSLRELRLLSDIRKEEPQHSIHLYSFGSIKEGHTGCTFEGLWLQGVLHALKQEKAVPYGADADHIKIDQGKSGIERAKEIILAARYYSFFTIDLSNIVKYDCMWEDYKSGESKILENLIGDKNELVRLMDYHKKPFVKDDLSVQLDSELIERFMEKYWKALDAFKEAEDYIKELKNSEKYDLELSIDESPDGYDIESILTTEAEVVFLLREFERRNISVTHLAPNFGVEKGVDYRMPGGLKDLEKRVNNFYTICNHWGVMLDCHSGDDLSSDTRQVFKIATEGNIHFKISPSLQEMYADLLYDMYPTVFGCWWQKTIQYVSGQAINGSSFASECLDAYYSEEKEMRMRNKLFHYYHFVPIGEYDSQGRLLLREMFYNLPSEFYDKYTETLKEHIEMLSSDLFNLEELEA